MNPTLYGPDGKMIPPSLIGLGRKSTNNPSEEDRVISYCVQGARGSDCIIPIIFDRRIIGWTEHKGYWNPDVTFHRVRPGYKFAVTTYDDIITGMANGRKYIANWSKTHTTAPIANNWYDGWPVTGNPTAGTYTGAARTARSLTDADTGALYHGGNVSTFAKYLTSMMAMGSAGTPAVQLYDRVLTYEACAFSVSLQSMTNGVAAARYMSAGQYMKMTVTVQTVNGATATDLTALAYTNQAGTGSRAMPTTPTVHFIPSAAAPTATLGARVVAPSTSGQTVQWGQFLPFQQGDSGVQSIQSFTCSAANTGTICFILNHPLFWMATGAAGIPSQVDCIFQTSGMEQIFDGACLSFFYYFPTATAATLTGEVDDAWN